MNPNKSSPASTRLLPAAEVHGIPVHAPEVDDFKGLVRGALGDGGANDHLRTLFTLNPEIIMMAGRDRGYREILRRGDWNVVDGIGLLLGLKSRSIKVPARLCGSDVIFTLAEEARAAGRGLCIIGGTSERLRLACENLRSMFPGLSVDGISPDLSDISSQKENSALLRFLEQRRPAVLAVCLGAPKQETWIMANHSELQKCGARIAAGLGGTVDFLSGEIPRAPKLIRQAGFEWLFRLAREPKRIARQLKSLPAFALSILHPGFIKTSPKRRPITLYAHYLPPHPSASATRMGSLARTLKEAGHAVSMLSSMPGENSYNGITIHRCHGRVGLFTWLWQNRGGALLVSSPPGTPAAEVAFMARILGYRVVVDVRDPYVSEALVNGDLKPGIKSSLKKSLETLLIRSAHTVAFVSPQLRETVQHLIGKIPSATVIAPNGVDVSIFNFDRDTRQLVRSNLGYKNEPVFVYAGILGGKSLDHAFLALAPALRAGARLLIIAVIDEYSKPIKDSLQRLLAEAQVSTQVTWLENQPLREVAAYLNAADIGINPLPTTRLYCLPVKGYEYLACGLYNLAFGNPNGALSTMLADPQVGSLSVTWDEFTNNALKIVQNIDAYRCGAQARSALALKYDRSASNRTLERALLGDEVK